MNTALAPSRRRRLRRGSTLIYMTATLTLTVGFAAFSVDMGHFRAAKGELQALADAAALNAANGLSDNSYAAKANAVAAENQVDGAAATIAAGDVVPGYWSGSAFTANGAPRNAVKVTVSRTKAAGTSVTSTMGATLGWLSPDLTASSTVALIAQTPYEWSATNSLSFTGTSSANRVTAFDATNPYAAQSTTTLKSDGSVTLAGTSAINGDVQYGSSASISGSTSVSGSTMQIATASTYPPGSQAANLNGVIPTYAATYDMAVATSMIIPGGVYVMKNFTVSNCNITFAGPVTIVATGNCSFTNVGVTTYGNLPANLKIITTTPGTSMTITNPTLPLYADIYAPDTNFTYNSAAGYKELRGRGIFRTMTVSGDGASLWYDRSLTSTTMSKKPVVVD